MKYRLTTIEQDAAGNVYRVEQPQAARSTLTALVRGAKIGGYLTRDGYALKAKSGTNRPIIAVEFHSEETPC